MKVTQENIDNILNNSEVKEIVIFDKCLICAYKLPNGFIMVESSACVDPKNFDLDIGRKICREHIENRLWELEGYVLQKSAYKESKPRSATEIKEAVDNLSPEAKAIYDSLLAQIKQQYPVKI